MDDLRAIKGIVDNYYNCDISKNTRRQDYIVARAVYYRLCRKFTNKSTTMIGRFIRRDHATVLYALKNFEAYEGAWKGYNSCKGTFFILKAQEIQIDEESTYKAEAQILKQKLLMAKGEITKLKQKMSEFNTSSLIDSRLYTIGQKDLIEFNETRVKPYLRLYESRNASKDTVWLRTQNQADNSGAIPLVD